MDLITGGYIPLTGDLPIEIVNKIMLYNSHVPL